MALSGLKGRVANYLFGLLQPNTQLRYARALEAFDRWASLGKLRFHELDEEKQDFLLAEYLLEMRDGGAPLHHANDTIAAIQKCYGGRRRYRAAGAVSIGWHSEHLVDQAQPFPEVVLYAFVAALCGAQRPQFGVALLVSFCGLLRISECLALTWSDIYFPDQHKSGNYVVLTLRRTKTEAANVAKVILRDAGVVAFLQRFRTFRNPKPNEQFIGASYTALRRWLRRTSKALGFDPDTFRSHSCRRWGGGTALSLRGWSISDIMVMGRWQSDSSCRLYIKGGEVALLRLSAVVTPEQQARIEVLARGLPRVPFGR